MPHKPIHQRLIETVKDDIRKPVTIYIDGEFAGTNHVMISHFPTARRQGGKNRPERLAARRKLFDKCNEVAQPRMKAPAVPTPCDDLQGREEESETEHTTRK